MHGGFRRCVGGGEHNGCGFGKRQAIRPIGLAEGTRVYDDDGMALILAGEAVSLGLKINQSCVSARSGFYSSLDGFSKESFSAFNQPARYAS